MDGAQQTRVLLLTDQHRITGRIALPPGARLTDFMCAAKIFIAVVDAEVEQLDGRPVLRAAFLNVHRDHVRLATPVAPARADGTPDETGRPAHG